MKQIIYILILVISFNISLYSNEINDKKAAKILILPPINIPLSVKDNKKIDLKKSFSNLKKYTEGYDIVFSSLFSPITKHDKYQEKLKKSYYYRANSEDALFLKDLNINLLSLANNNIMDFFEKGLFDTIDFLKNNNIQYIGAGENEYKARSAIIYKVNDIKIGFLAYNRVWPYEYTAKKNSAGVAFSYVKNLKEDISRLKEKCDFIIVKINVGKLYSKHPQNELFTKKNKMAEVKTLLKRAVDYGADVVVGTNAMRIQGISKYKKGIIFYSTGSMFPLYTKQKFYDSFMIKLDIKDKKSFYYEVVPIRSILNNEIYYPTVVFSKVKDAIIKYINDRSNELK